MRVFVFCIVIVKLSISCDRFAIVSSDSIVPATLGYAALVEVWQHLASRTQVQPEALAPVKKRHVAYFIHES